MKHTYLQTQVPISSRYETHLVKSVVLNSRRQPQGYLYKYRAGVGVSVPKAYVLNKGLLYNLVLLLSRGICEKWSLVGGSWVTEDIILTTSCLSLSLCVLTTVNQVAFSSLCSRPDVLSCYSPKRELCDCNHGLKL